MAMRDILLRFDSAALDGPWRDPVIKLAQTQEAHLTGLFVLQAPDLPSFTTVEIPVDMIRNYEEAERESAQATKRSFLAAGDAAGLSVEWREAVDRGDADAAEIQGRYADLLVVGMPADPGLAKDAAAMAGRLTLAIGGPLLVLPCGSPPSTVGRRVLVAWNASREASRAVRDALPLLAAAERVVVFSVNPPDSEPVPGADICAHLARHGVKAEANHTVAHHVEAGDALLSAASDMDADLLVMGAYGRSRFQEFVLGGVTKEVLVRMPMPVLMAH